TRMTLNPGRREGQGQGGRVPGQSDRPAFYRRTFGTPGATHRCAANDGANDACTPQNGTGSTRRRGPREARRLDVRAPSDGGRGSADGDCRDGEREPLFGDPLGRSLRDDLCEPLRERVYAIAAAADHDSIALLTSSARRWTSVSASAPRRRSTSPARSN